MPVSDEIHTAVVQHRNKLLRENSNLKGYVKILEDRVAVLEGQLMWSRRAKADMARNRRRMAAEAAFAALSCKE